MCKLVTLLPKEGDGAVRWGGSDEGCSLSGYFLLEFGGLVDFSTVHLTVQSWGN